MIVQRRPRAENRSVLTDHSRFQSHLTSLSVHPSRSIAARLISVIHAAAIQTAENGAKNVRNGVDREIEGLGLRPGSDSRAVPQSDPGAKTVSLETGLRSPICARSKHAQTLTGRPFRPGTSVMLTSDDRISKVMPSDLYRLGFLSIRPSLTGRDREAEMLDTMKADLGKVPDRLSIGDPNE